MRNDPDFTTNLTRKYRLANWKSPFNAYPEAPLTDWGFKDCTTSPQNGADGAWLPKRKFSRVGPLHENWLEVNSTAKKFTSLLSIRQRVQPFPVDGSTDSSPISSGNVDGTTKDLSRNTSGKKERNQLCLQQARQLPNSLRCWFQRSVKRLWVGHFNQRHEGVHLNDLCTFRYFLGFDDEKL